MAVCTPSLSSLRWSEMGQAYVLAWDLSLSPAVIDVSMVPCHSRSLYFADTWHLATSSRFPRCQQDPNWKPDPKDQAELRLTLSFCLTGDVATYGSGGLVSSAS
jgi:hypothetical protein